MSPEITFAMPNFWNSLDIRQNCQFWQLDFLTHSYESIGQYSYIATHLLRTFFLNCKKNSCKSQNQTKIINVPTLYSLTELFVQENIVILWKWSGCLSLNWSITLMDTRHAKSVKSSADNIHGGGNFRKRSMVQVI